MQFGRDESGADLGDRFRARRRMRRRRLRQLPSRGRDDREIDADDGADAHRCVELVGNLVVEGAIERATSGRTWTYAAGVTAPERT